MELVKARSEKTVKGTGTQLAEKLGIEKLTFNKLIGSLVEIGAAKVVDRQKSATGKGMPANVYEVPSEITLTFENSQ